MKPRPKAGEAGFALLIVLWTVAILALLVAAVVGASSREAALTATLRDEAIGRAAADGAIASTVMDILQFRDASPGARVVAGLRADIALEDLSGRLNPNVVSAKMLAALLSELGVAPPEAGNLAAAIVDWRSPGQVPTPHGAKAPQYRSAGLDYGPPGRPFESLDELGYVLGMTPRLLAALKPHLTLWTASDPDPAYADPLVLSALRAAGAPPSAGSANQARIVRIGARVRIGRIQVVSRRAVIRFGFSPDGRGWRVLEWDDGNADGGAWRPGYLN